MVPPPSEAAAVHERLSSTGDAQAQPDMDGVFRTDPQALQMRPGVFGAMVESYSQEAGHSPIISDEVTGMRPPLRAPVPAEPIDALSIAPNPGAMGSLYIEMRERHSDGMPLALAKSRRPYTEIIADYVIQRNQPDFSANDFWDRNFVMQEQDSRIFEAPPGMNINEYIRAIRPMLIRPSIDDGSSVRLPYAAPVAGDGRFSYPILFGWDGHHANQGYKADGRWDLILDSADNTEHIINVLGCGANGNVGPLATRAHPPYFANTVGMLAREYGNEALVRYLPAMEKEYKYWMDGREELERLRDDGRAHTFKTLVRLPLGKGQFTYFNRYKDSASGPRLESRLEDEQLGELVTRGLTGELKQRRLQKLEDDIRASAASGWDHSSRWFADGRTMATFNTTEIAPVDLQCLMALLEQTLSRAHHAAGNTNEALFYNQRFKQRVYGINKFNYDPDSKIFRDLNFVQKRQTAIESAAAGYPLYVGIANAEQTYGFARLVNDKLLFPGGVVATTTEESDQQWDGGKLGGGGQKNVWAPPNWATARGLARMAHKLKAAEPDMDVQLLLKTSDRVRSNFMHGVQVNFNATRKIPEKINGENLGLGNGGEYDPIGLLTMTAEVFRGFDAWDPYDPKGSMPLGALALAH